MDEALGRGDDESSAPESGDDALGVLARDHRELRERFDELLTAIDDGADAATRARRVLELGCLLVSHTRAEEEVFFARMYRQPDLRPTTERCLDEHTELEVLLSHLARLDVDDEGWLELLWTLESSFELHAEQEEREVYPQAIAAIGVAEVDALLRRYETCRARWVRHLDGDLGDAGPGHAAPL